MKRVQRNLVTLSSVPAVSGCHANRYASIRDSALGFARLRVTDRVEHVLAINRPLYEKCLIDDVAGKHRARDRPMVCVNGPYRLRVVAWSIGPDMQTNSAPTAFSDAAMQKAKYVSRGLKPGRIRGDEIN